MKVSIFRSLSLKTILVIGCLITLRGIALAHDKVIVIPMLSDDPVTLLVCPPLVIPAFSTVSRPSGLFSNTFYVDVLKTCPEFVAGDTGIGGGSNISTYGTPSSTKTSIFLELQTGLGPDTETHLYYFDDAPEEPIRSNPKRNLAVTTNSQQFTCEGLVQFDHYIEDEFRVLSSKEIVLDCIINN